MSPSVMLLTLPSYQIVEIGQHVAGLVNPLVANLEHAFRHAAHERPADALAPLVAAVGLRYLAHGLGDDRLDVLPAQRGNGLDDELFVHAEFHSGRLHHRRLEDDTRHRLADPRRVRLVLGEPEVHRRCGLTVFLLGVGEDARLGVFLDRSDELSVDSLLPSARAPATATIRMSRVMNHKQSSTTTASGSSPKEFIEVFRDILLSTVKPAERVDDKQPEFTVKLLLGLGNVIAHELYAFRCRQRKRARQYDKRSAREVEVAR